MGGGHGMRPAGAWAEVAVGLLGSLAVTDSSLKELDSGGVSHAIGIVRYLGLWGDPPTPPGFYIWDQHLP